MAQTFARYKECALIQITPKGWLKEFLVRQKDGMTGHPEALSYPYNTCLWAGEIARKNEIRLRRTGGGMSRLPIIRTDCSVWVIC